MGRVFLLAGRWGTWSGSFLEKVAGKGLRHGGLRRVPGRCVGGRPGWSPPPLLAGGWRCPVGRDRILRVSDLRPRNRACRLQACLASLIPDPVALKQDPGNCKPAACMIRVSRARIPPRGVFLKDILGPVLGSGHPRGHFWLPCPPDSCKKGLLLVGPGSPVAWRVPAARVHELRLSGGLAFPRRCSELMPQTPVGTCSPGWPAGGRPA